MGIIVISEPCGTGKTTWAINTINANPDKSYIYCTPLLSEIRKVRKECAGVQFFDPPPLNGRKLEGFNSLLARGENIAVTHQTFLNADDETLRLIREGDYTLILDEELDVIRDFNSIQTTKDNARQQVSKDDVDRLLRKGMIAVADNFKVEWTDEDQSPEGKDYEVMRLSKLGRLYCARNSLLVAVFPPSMFNLFNQVYVLTYLFSGSILEYYFQLFDLSFNRGSVEKLGNRYELTDYNDKADLAYRKSCKTLIHQCENRNLYVRRNLTANWYDNARQEDLRRMSNDIRTFFSGISNLSVSDCMWTARADRENRIAPKGYTQIRKLTRDELRLPKEELREVKAKAKTFVPCNAVATNIYRERWALAYGVNLYYNPVILGLFEDCGIKVNQDDFATSCMIQWISRSRIRDGKPIELYVPSSRMRKLLNRWTDAS